MTRPKYLTPWMKSSRRMFSSGPWGLEPEWLTPKETTGVGGWFAPQTAPTGPLAGSSG
ncbi:MAG TPA: hypothetical protein VF611_03040 [Pyrinomonadaceae bacterium]